MTSSTLVAASIAFSWLGTRWARSLLVLVPDNAFVGHDSDLGNVFENLDVLY